MIDVEKPVWNAPRHIKAFTSTRRGGVSSEPYNSLNLGAHVGDSSQSVLKNRQILSTHTALPSNPVWLNQVHGVELLEVGSTESSTSAATADGAHTRAPNLVCAIMTADCLPLFITNRKGDQVAILHAGWRGMAAGIIEAGVSVFNEEPSEIIAWAGPCIGPNVFEVGLEVPRLLGGPEQAYRPVKAAKKVAANLYLLAGARLAALGVHEYSHSKACTFSEPDRYFSYRRDGDCGRMANLIWIEK